MDDDEDVPLNPAPTEKPKVPEGISAFNIASARSGADLFEEESAAIAGEDVTIIVQLPDKELEVKVRGGRGGARARGQPRRARRWRIWRAAPAHRSSSRLCAASRSHRAPGRCDAPARLCRARR